MTLKTRHLVLLLAWAGALYGLQFLATLPGDLGEALFGHSLCGPWGCLPPLQGLVAWHGVLVLLFVPLVLWAVWSWSPVRLWALGVGLAGLGLLGLGVVAGREVLTCWVTSPAQRPYTLQHILFAVATLGDVPLVQVTLAGLICWLVGRRRLAARRLSPRATPAGPPAPCSGEQSPPPAGPNLVGQAFQPDAGPVRLEGLTYELARRTP
jgi:hypothetical protein